MSDGWVAPYSTSHSTLLNTTTALFTTTRATSEFGKDEEEQEGEHALLEESPTTYLLTLILAVPALIGNTVSRHFHFVDKISI